MDMYLVCALNQFSLLTSVCVVHITRFVRWRKLKKGVKCRSVGLWFFFLVDFIQRKASHLRVALHDGKKPQPVLCLSRARCGKMKQQGKMRSAGVRLGRPHPRRSNQRICSS